MTGFIRKLGPVTLSHIVPVTSLYHNRSPDGFWKVKVIYRLTIDLFGYRHETEFVEYSQRHREGTRP